MFPLTPGLPCELSIHLLTLIHKDTGSPVAFPSKARIPLTTCTLLISEGSLFFLLATQCHSNFFHQKPSDRPVTPPPSLETWRLAHCLPLRPSLIIIFVHPAPWVLQPRDPTLFSELSIIYILSSFSLFQVPLIPWSIIKKSNSTSFIPTCPAESITSDLLWVCNRAAKHWNSVLIYDHKFEMSSQHLLHHPKRFFY